MTRKATDELQKTSTAYRNQRNELLGLVDAITRNSDVSDEDRVVASNLFEEYRKGRITAEQLAGGINQLKTVNANAKASIDDKVFSLKEEAKKVVEADRVLKIYNGTIKQGTTDNTEHAKSVDKVSDAYANLSAKQMEYVNGAKQNDQREQYVNSLVNNHGWSRDKADFYADAQEKSGTPFTKAMPKGVMDAVNAEWKREQATKARVESEKKAEESQKQQTREFEKQQKILQVNERVKANAQKYNFAGLEQKYQLPTGSLSSIHMIESGVILKLTIRRQVQPVGFNFLKERLNSMV